ncbi:putative succinate dehydrogenase cytochrome b560 subunit [Erysiphe necator]|uniref:Putative succinate dehydrogenase cytochrome b560 subunit n=1 Tax=Uncinula necator TaxID=52586 RepID=A0A0B1PA17_UNCNE|nr:putative succinate dehydrogenase cytochrome b560 subunit [Erysiphe necator]WPT47863.1 succinate dehydrogenase subunit C [Erysiphe necator]WPT47864.1 succinate dehydrogenase subunit C [Erysiphe necator]WPT47865.1 succinate dehydrogenase subunit C [Erysiphe necator]WPT47867.1 succinate dehydrogenase subunit C [Erysiphe necator]
MLSQRIGQQSFQRTLRSLRASHIAGTQVQVPITLGSIYLKRNIETHRIKSSESYEILVAQRKKRPTSPHLTIYRPQITWYLSALNRITGCLISGGFYTFGAAYLVSSLLGWHMNSAFLATAFGALPLALKLGIKTLVALPFTFHSINGVRHLVWDMGKAFTNKAVIRTGWMVVGLSISSALALVALV